MRTPTDPATAPRSAASAAPDRHSGADPSATGDSELVVIRPKRQWRLGLGEVLTHRELLYFLMWRDVKVRYKQTALGAMWAVFQPLILMIVFAVFLGHLARVPSNGLPYALFVYTALVPWTLFSSAVTWAAPSLVKNGHLISRVYFPRLLLPVAAVGSFLLDFVIALVLLFGLMWFYGFGLGPRAFMLLPFLLLAIVAALGVGTVLSALNARYRDVQHAVPLLVQVWLFLSPVIYPSSLVPEGWRTIFGLNPMASVADGFRWALLDPFAPAGASVPAPPGASVVASVGVALLLLLGGLLYFQRVERSFADVI